MEQQNGGFEDRKVALGNQMQIQLAVLHGEQVEDFIERHATEFREIINSNPELLDTYTQDPEGTLKKVSEIIYH